MEIMLLQDFIVEFWLGGGSIDASMNHRNLRGLGDPQEKF